MIRTMVVIPKAKSPSGAGLPILQAMMTDERWIVCFSKEQGVMLRVCVRMLFVWSDLWQCSRCRL